MAHLDAESEGDDGKEGGNVKPIQKKAGSNKSVGGQGWVTNNNTDCFIAQKALWPA